MPDPHGAKQDYIDELIAQDEREAHEAGECKRGCPLCLEAKERGDESLGG